MPRTSPSPSAGGHNEPVRAVPSLREPRYSQSLERGLAILAVFTPARPALGIAEIASELGMSRSTTHRYVITLLALGYLEQGASRKYRLTLRVTQLGMSAISSTPLHQYARAYLEELRERHSYTIYLGVLDGTEVMLLEHVRGLHRGRHAIELEISTGSRLPAHCTATGKLLLAHLPERYQSELVSELALARHGPHTITSRRALREELERIRARGLATSREELAPHLHGIAMPVRDALGEVVAGVNLLASSTAGSLPELLEETGAQLRATADGLSERLGYRAVEAAGH